MGKNIKQFCFVRTAADAANSCIAIPFDGIRSIHLEGGNTALKIQFEGDTNTLNDSLITFDSLDSEIDFNGRIKITKTNHIFLEDFLISIKLYISINTILSSFFIFFILSGFPFILILSSFIVSKVGINGLKLNLFMM